MQTGREKGCVSTAFIVAVALLTTIILTPSFSHAFGPSDDDLKAWLDGREMVLKKGILSDDKIIIRGYNIKTIHRTHYSEERKSGVAEADFTYVNDANILNCEAAFHYIYEDKWWVFRKRTVLDAHPRVMDE
jgi:hypothetical protein